MPPNRFFRLFATASAMAVLATGTPWTASAASCSSALITESGHCAKRIAPHRLTARQRQARSDREQAHRAASKALSSRSNGRMTMLPKDPKPFQPRYLLPELSAMRIYEEGEGNGGLTYTCGPSSMRNMLAALYKRKTGHYRDLGERKLMGWAGTKRIGTARANIATGLNNHVPNLGYWETLRPRSSQDYLSWVVSSTALQGRAVIANVDTWYLPYFHGKKLMHFNLVYGYDVTKDRGGTNQLRVAEEWSRTYRNWLDPKTHRRITFNPYGKHWVPLGRAYGAIMHPANHGIVA